MDMDISMDIHAKSVDMDMDMDGKFHIHGNPGVNRARISLTQGAERQFQLSNTLLLKLNFLTSSLNYELNLKYSFVYT